MLNRIKLYITLITFLCVSLHAETYVINPDGGDIYYKTAGYAKGQKGISNLQIANNAMNVSYDSDMLFHFNKNIYDACGNYKAVASEDIKYNTGVFGNNMSVYFPSDVSHIELIPKQGAFFSSYEKIPSFTIEFYLDPGRYIIDGDIISKIGPYRENGENMRGGIRAYIRRGQLMWEFANFFYLENDVKSVTLTKGSYLKAGQWQHHSVSYDASTGKLVKYLNGLEQEIVYVTTTGDSYGSIFYGKFSYNNRNPLYVGYGYTGGIDELAVTMGFKNKFNIEKYKPSSVALTRVIDLKSEAAVIDNIDAMIRTENGSSVTLYYRASNIIFLPEDYSIEWVQVKNKNSIKKIARYIQIKAELYTDGNGEAESILGPMSINYNVVEPPLKPTGLTALAMNGKVKLTWDKVSGASGVTGYKIYYGTKKGVYYGVGSPIIIGKQNEYVVDNLSNGTLYYFTISAFDEFGQMHESIFAQEVYARPDALENKE